VPHKSVDERVYLSGESLRSIASNFTRRESSGVRIESNSARTYVLTNASNALWRLGPLGGKPSFALGLALPLCYCSKTAFRKWILFSAASWGFSVWV
jgi:hypothetical protein